MQLDSLDVSCPFLRAQRAEIGSQQQATLVAASARKASDITTAEVIRLIVSKQLALPNLPIEPFVERLEKELISNCAVLFSLSLDLSRLGLPLALEDALSKMIKLHSRPASSSSSGAAPAISELQKNASALFGLKNELRQAVIQSWAAVSKSQSRFPVAGNAEFNLARFVDEITKSLFDLSPNMKSLYSGSSLHHTKDVIRLVQLFAKVAEDPVQGSILLRKHAAAQLIYSVDKKDYDAIALSIIKAMEMCLPDGQMTSHVREGWYTLATTAGEFMIATYDELKVGIRYSGWKRTGSKWRNIIMRVTERKILFFKETDDDTSAKSKEEIDLTSIEGCEPTEDDLTNKPTDNCISIQLRGAGGELVYICVPNEEQRQRLLDDLNRRLKAWDHIRTLNPETNATNALAAPLLGKTQRGGSGLMQMGRRGSSAHARDVSSSNSEEDSGEDRTPDRVVSPRRHRASKLEPTLENSLIDKELGASFCKFLITIQAKHIFEFMEQIENVWRKQNFSDTSETNQRSILTLAQTLSNRFLSLQSDECLSVADDQRGIVSRAIKSGKTPVNPKLFDQAANEVRHQLLGHFVTFKAQLKN